MRIMDVYYAYLDGESADRYCVYERVVALSAARCSFTVDELKEKTELKEFFVFKE